MRKSPDLDAMYGSVQPPRAKPGKKSGIQKGERNKDGMVIIHPGRIVLNPNITPDLPQLLDVIRHELQDGGVFKWTVARNGQLMLGLYQLSDKAKQLLLTQSEHPDKAKLMPGQSRLVDLLVQVREKPTSSSKDNKDKLALGHPTLVGGLREPEARIGGELRYGKLHEDDPEPTFYINNDSGRYSEYADRTEAMLKNVANRFKDLGFSVKEKWLDKSKVALRIPKVSAEDGSSSRMARQGTDS